MKFSYVLLLSVLLISFVGAIPPTQTNTIIDSGIDVESPIISVHTQNESFKFHVHTYNSTDGTRFTNETISCFIHLYSPTNGGHLIEENMSFDSNGIDFEYEVAGGNFSELGQYAVLMDCEDTVIGGYIEYGFDVTANGKIIPESSPFFMLGLIALIFSTACFFLYFSMSMNEVAFKIFFMVMSFIFLMSSFIITYMYSSDMNIISGINSSILSLIYVLGAILFIMFMYIMIRQTVIVLDMFKVNKGLKMSPGYNVGSGSKTLGINPRRPY